MIEEHHYVDLRPGTPQQVQRALDKLARKGWTFMAFDTRRNDKGKVVPGVIVWVRRMRLAGHG